MASGSTASPLSTPNKTTRQAPNQLDQCTSLVEILRYRAKHQPNQIAYIGLENGETESGRLTYAQLDEKARAIAGALGKQMVQLGIVELSTQAVGGLLKGHALTYIAGGAVQGVSAAYLTRLAGLSLVESFAAMSAGAERELNLSVLQQKLQAVFALTKRADIFEGLFAQARARLPLTRSDASQIDVGAGAS